MKCEEVVKYLFLFIDGEIEPNKAIEIERHIEKCEKCKARYILEKRFKERLSSLKGEIKPPEELKLKIDKALSRGEKLDRIKRIVPLALVASLLIILCFVFYNYRQASLKRSYQDSPENNIIEELVTWHTHKVPVEVKGPDIEKVSSWFKEKVPFPVKAPSFTPVKASLIGGRLSGYRPFPSVYLLYKLRGRKVSVMIFKPNRINFYGMKKIHLNNKDIYYTTFNELNIIVWNKGEVSYAITSELPIEELLSLVDMLE